MAVIYIEDILPERDAVLALYELNHWSAAEKPVSLLKALANSDHLVAAYDGEKLIGLANAITDGHLVVYYPHLLVHPAAQGGGVGRGIMERMKAYYSDLHQHVLVSVAGAVGFYEQMGFRRPSNAAALWIYDEEET